MGDESEILLGKLAETRGAAIKDFAVALVQDHIQARDQADQLARSEGMTPPTQPTPAAKRELAKLQGLSGPGFDYEFVHYEIKDHRRDIRAYRRAAAKGGPVGDLAHATLPVLQKHLRMAVGLAQQGA
jgi:putative membrane protein